jgi:hypothetical protein
MNRALTAPFRPGSGVVGFSAINVAPSRTGERFEGDRTMKKFLIPALALAAASVAVPAAAQIRADVYVGSNAGYGYGDRGHGGYGYGYDRNWQPIHRRVANLDRRIDQGLRNGALSRREASSLRAELNALVRLERQYSRNGLSRQEVRDLDYRFDRLSQRVRIERRDRDGRGRW